MATEEIKDAIVANATGPKSVEGDEATVQQHSIADQIAAAQFVAGKTAVKKPHRGMRFTQVVKPGPE